MMIFVELPKFSPQTYNEKKMQVLWLRYLTEINEKTLHVDEELLNDKNLNKALELVEESAYTDAELYAIDHYWDAVSRERTALAEKYEKGLAEGDRQRQILSAKSMIADGLPESLISKYTDLDIEEIKGL